MKILLILFSLLFFSGIVGANDLFITNEYILKFKSKNITLDKKKKINDLKIKSFQKILTNILSKEDFKKINTRDVLFINNFILNIKINN